jgi:hypothetical protein
MKSLILILTVALLAGCSGDNNGPVDNNTIPSAQTIIAGYQHINWAWGYSHGARYLDRDGNVLSVTYAAKDSLWLLTGKDILTIPEMNKLVTGASILDTTIPRDTVLSAARLTKYAAQGPYSDTTMLGADMGEGEWFGYTFDTTTSSYHRVILKVSGDWSWDNTAPTAAKLVSIIEQFRTDPPTK